MRVVFGFGALITSYFGETGHVRFSSLYKSPEFTDCAAIKYPPGNQHVSTPTFHCLVRGADRGSDFIRKADALAKQYHIVEEDGLKYLVTAS
ncbi:hypothetical protein F0Q45_23870 [Mycobacterium simiae]|uniref:Uncharacterized protein n=1 Tax=Mycobacterium simiae TaxID=1784 RepID=A0A5B1BFA1_MYCSI|nr:hypothetical protein [Mycobacterium simiae]KAA1245779.1 hypothetical protein F0Q45_23870 [Mycobacterium simiae]